MATVRVTQIGNSLGVILPRDLAERLRVRKGDELSVVETPDGIELTRYDPDFEEKMALAREVTRRYRNALRELAR